MNIFKSHRTPQSKMLMVLAIGTALGILPFAIYRALQHDWYVAVLDLVVVLGMTVMFVYVYLTNDVKKTSLALILLALSANVVSFYLKGISQIYWIYPAMLAGYYVMSPKKGLMVNFIMLTFYVPKLISSLDSINLSTILITIIITNIISYVFASGLCKQQQVLTKLVLEDYLTATGNRLALKENLQELNKYLQNHDKTASIVLLDLDYFKKVNDQHGHIKGDQILVHLAKILKDFYRNNEKIFRFGGEEFLIVCPDIDIEQAFDQAQALRKRIKENIVIDENEQTVSLGVAEYIKEESNEEWIHRVDLALYQAKNSGRDRVIKSQ